MKRLTYEVYVIKASVLDFIEYSFAKRKKKSI